jgi:hypothetical protein
VAIRELAPWHRAPERVADVLGVLKASALLANAKPPGGLWRGNSVAEPSGRDRGIAQKGNCLVAKGGR